MAGRQSWLKHSQLTARHWLREDALYKQPSASAKHQLCQGTLGSSSMRPCVSDICSDTISTILPHPPCIGQSLKLWDYYPPETSGSVKSFCAASLSWQLCKAWARGCILLTASSQRAAPRSRTQPTSSGPRSQKARTYVEDRTKFKHSLSDNKEKEKQSIRSY